MKKQYITIDGLTFNDELEAESHEKSVLLKTKKKFTILKNDEILNKMNPHDVIVVNCNYDEAGNSRSHEYLVGDKEEIIQHIAVHHKYWFYDSYYLTKLETIKLYK